MMFRIRNDFHNTFAQIGRFGVSHPSELAPEAIQRAIGRTCDCPGCICSRFCRVIDSYDTVWEYDAITDSWKEK